MDVDVRQIQDASERLLAAVDRMAPRLTYDELIRVGDQLDVVARALSASTAARPVETTATGDDGPDRLSHPLRRVDG
jgi:hypothetical protein